RARLARAARAGIVVPEGLIAHGRGEAFDYLLGERSIPSALRAARLAAEWIRRAERPVISVNGNVAALAAPEIAELARAFPRLRVEVNLFHRTPQRARAIAEALRRSGIAEVLGVRATGRLEGLPSDRARIDAEGIGRADLCVIPLEDGDRAEALRRAGKTVVAIDLNPLSRTARFADLTIVDELTRALRNITAAADRGPAPRPRKVPSSVFLNEARKAIRRNLAAASARGATKGPAARRPR
ncbi:MAG: phosphopantothenate/pantothenate synthetase, partial [Thermoplasmata archaeon]